MKKLTRKITIGGLITIALLYFFGFSNNFVRAGGCSLDIQKTYKSANKSSVYYVTQDCTKRAFTRGEIFYTYERSFSAVRTVSQAQLDAIENDRLGFMPWGPLYDPKYGALVKTVDDPKVYLLLGNEKYWISSPQIFVELGYQWNWIEDIDPRLLSAYRTASQITYTDHHPNFTLIKYPNSPKVYQLLPNPEDNTKQVRRHITSEQEFNELGFRWDRIVTIAMTEQYLDEQISLEEKNYEQKVKTSLQSDFFKDSAIVKRIVEHDDPLDLSKIYIRKGLEIDKGGFAFKLLNAFYTLGYHPERFENQKHLTLLHKFQARNNFPQTNVLSKEVIIKMDALLAERERTFSQYANQFPLRDHMKPMHVNDVSNDFVAFLYMLPIKVLPDHLQMKTEQEFINCIKTQCLGFVQPTDTPIVNYYNKDVPADSNYVFSGAYFDNERQYLWRHAPSTVVATVLHEYAHYLSAQVPTTESEPKHGIIDTAGFDAISHDTDEGWSCFPYREDNIYNFISRYGYGYNSWCLEDGTYFPGEDFAESFSAYVVNGRRFREAASKNNVLAQKYNWLKNNVFKGTEYNTDLVVGAETGCYDNTVNQEASPGWREPGYLSCSYDYVWDGELRKLP
jgi:hypothetical protein